MAEILIGIAIFVGLCAASLGALVWSDRLPPAWCEEPTYNHIRLVAALFVMLTSLVLGLMVNSARNTFDSVDRNMHALAIDLILLDRTLRAYGPEADEPRHHLLDYAERIEAARTAPPDPSRGPADGYEALMDGLAADIRLLKPKSAEYALLWNEAGQLLQKIVELRWTLIQQAAGTLPTPFLVMVVGWLVLIFASLGYRAPRNALVVSSLVASAALIAGTVYVIVDMNFPFNGPIKISPKPLLQAIAEMRR